MCEFIRVSSLQVCFCFLLRELHAECYVQQPTKFNCLSLVHTVVAKAILNLKNASIWCQHLMTPKQVLNCSIVFFLKIFGGHKSFLWGH